MEGVDRRCHPATQAGAEESGNSQLRENQGSATVASWSPGGCQRANKPPTANHAQTVWPRGAKNIRTALGGIISGANISSAANQACVRASGTERQTDEDAFGWIR
ncbi:predicted protein [Chaetomium globosum CBS 148.51]|uniref:Uncharacterized protein n=1 Tax=Chaetomium globosum (strain ATCC 6205 / CBS 148.51 / DSM 1962 / NBRC 6347 / NRRL 1970) TaxID=306901 RepID=Q2H7I8_CHAGB|nr:uncharacterized protein CHGG_05377 [Chaetomium globosum CBS 148.51]EAQ88758.1 predicted protein [Chaetomium globosum CBS 148.51]